MMKLQTRPLVWVFMFVGLMLCGSLTPGCQPNLPLPGDDTTAVVIATVTSTHTGTMDGEELAFEATMSLKAGSSPGAPGSITGNFAFLGIVQAEIPWIIAWTGAKAKTGSWILDHIFVATAILSDIAIDDEIDISIVATGQFYGGHVMTAVHEATGSSDSVNHVADFEVTSPAIAIAPRDFPEPMVMTSTHWPAGPGKLLVITEITSEDFLIATLQDVITINDQPNWFLPEPFVVTTVMTIVLNADGMSGSFAFEPSQRQTGSGSLDFECPSDSQICFCEDDDDCNDMFTSDVCGTETFPDAICDAGPPVTCTCTRPRVICLSNEDCDDGDACTDDICGSQGDCSSTPVVCEDDGDACTIESCSQESGGQCVSTPVSCLVTEVCSNGECVPVIQ